jgi:hypothetical protein
VLRVAVWLGALAAATAVATTAVAAAESSPCRHSEAARALDFWLGEWDVYVGRQLAGRDRVERILDGCAVTERWRDASGGEGFSLFAFDARKELWTQTWITGNSAVPGGIKAKVLRARAPGSTTFQGELEATDGTTYYDRTILTALPGGRVRQQIQISRDGVAWRTSFDAIYVPAATKR